MPSLIVFSMKIRVRRHILPINGSTSRCANATLPRPAGRLQACRKTAIPMRDLRIPKPGIKGFLRAHAVTRRRRHRLSHKRAVSLRRQCANNLITRRRFVSSALSTPRLGKKSRRFEKVAKRAHSYP